MINKFKKLLYIDDEVNNLTTFKSLFKEDYDIYTANSADEALKILNKTEVQLIISDQRMPGTTGIDFFSKIINIYPDPIRILLTGYADFPVLIDAINKGKVHQYISKPWESFEMRVAIENAINLYYLNKELLGAKNEVNKYKELYSLTPVKRKIFISHSTKDRTIVNSFVDNILKLGLGLSNQDIFCVSTEESGIRSGEDFRKIIKEELISSMLIIQIITENYKKSEVCLNEMGAAWVLNNKVVPFILDPITYENVGFIHLPNQLLKINQREKILKFVDDYKGIIFDEKINLSALDRQISLFIESLKNY